MRTLRRSDQGRREPTVIGISLDWSEDPRGRAFGLHQLRAAYADCVAAAGGIPVLLAPQLSNAALGALLGRLDGLVITGGAFDVSPELYGEKPLTQARPSRRSAPPSSAHCLPGLTPATCRFSASAAACS